LFYFVLSLCITQVGLELMIFPPSFLNCWVYRLALPHIASCSESLKKNNKKEEEQWERKGKGEAEREERRDRMRSGRGGEEEEEEEG
jgi:hypothetical protein